MIIELKKFLDVIAGSSALQEKISTFKSPGDIIGLAKEMGYNVNFSDLQGLKNMRPEIDYDHDVAGGFIAFSTGPATCPINNQCLGCCEY